ncbi:MAG TPA: alpha-L-fucosidase [Lacunisphaera sp.]|jgi:alpha-L-fucosidase|nr:alpha-L-fucosidase [Lacunisphaera sp.]
MPPRSLLALSCLAAVLGAAELPPPGLRTLDEPDSARDARVAWHREARFGCFVHWGVYSALGNEFEGRRGGTYAEHIMRVLKIPRATYLEQIAKKFNPVDFDADAWVKLMHDAGMRYLVITAKHHDGFAMYPSKVSDYNLTQVTPFQRDPMAELSAACRKYGLKFGFYYSHAWDWEHPDAIGNGWDYGPPGGESGWWVKHPELVAKAQRYIDGKSIPQIRELIAKYHPDIMWFDTSSKQPPELCRRVLVAVRAADPDLVINSRIGGGNFGDYRSTSDRPAYFPEVPNQWEGIPTTNESYGYNKFDHSQKPPAHFIRLLAMAVGKGGNILMNIGPRGDGTIAPEDQAILRGIGAWMQPNGESIYGCDRTPLPVQPWGTSTRKANRLYLHVFDWPADGKLVVGGLRSNPSTVHLLHAGDELGVDRLNADDLELTLPSAAPDPVDSVIVLDFPAQIATNRAIRLAPGVSPTRLHVMDGRLDGPGIRYGDGKATRDVVEEWSGGDASVTWVVRVPQTTTFSVAAQYNTHNAAETGTYTLAAASQVLRGKVTPTAEVTTLRTDELGPLILPAGEHTIVIRPAEIAGGNLMRLRQLELTPVP